MKFMKWLAVYDKDGNVQGYECSNCKFYTRQKMSGCPFCKRPELDE